jgi:hypothetical protein
VGRWRPGGNAGKRRASSHYCGTSESVVVELVCTTGLTLRSGNSSSGLPRARSVMCDLHGRRAMVLALCSRPLEAHRNVSAARNILRLSKDDRRGRRIGERGSVFKIAGQI